VVERSDYDLLTIDQVARTLGQSVRTVRRMIRDGEFPDGFPAPRALRWRWATVRDWIVRQEAAAQARNSTLPIVDKRGQDGTTRKPA
jgi:excisionase family DNA binding protein